MQNVINRLVSSSYENIGRVNKYLWNDAFKALDCGKIAKLEKQADITKTRMEQLAKDVNEANDTLDQIMKNRNSDIDNMENKIGQSLVNKYFSVLMIEV